MIGKNKENLAPLKARQGACVVGILDDDDLMEIAQLVEEANKFKPQELNEANVQAIFNRCLAKEGEGNLTYAQVLMPELSGKQSDLIRFSKERIKANSKNISYLYGQLKGVHLQARLIPWNLALSIIGMKSGQPAQIFY